MNRFKNIIVCTALMATLLSISNISAFDWRAYRPDWSTWENVKSSYINPAWQKITSISPDYAKALGNTALTGITIPPGKIGMAASAYSAMEPIYNRYTKRESISPQERSKLDYLADMVGHTSAAVLPALIRLYQEGKIDSKILYRILSDPMVLATAGASAATGLAAAGFEWFNEPINIETASVDQLKKHLAELQAKRASLRMLWNTEEQRLAAEWTNIQSTITSQVNAIDSEIQAINNEIAKQPPHRD